MKQYILDNLLMQGELDFFDVSVRVGVAVAVGIIIYIAYYFSATRVTFSRRFAVSLIAMSAITAAIMAVISSNIALSLGMVGALSIIRFRTAIKDPQDAVHIFWCIMAGICCGVAQYVVALTATALVFVLLLVFGRIRKDSRYLLVVRSTLERKADLESDIFKTYPGSRLQVMNTTPDTAELIYDLRDGKAKKKLDELLALLYGKEGVSYVNLVLQNSELQE
ncbi:MAG TPA: DUF4956 domain-containing protein [Oscillospiraceae bacterium]|nr:DUF4956 domain-containing protein [Oscillospiraceae bacterium]HNW04411.1 DUF4956 domain-containing protein [Oscillospiraceae bacterium]